MSMPDVLSVSVGDSCIAREAGSRPLARSRFRIRTVSVSVDRLLSNRATAKHAVYCAAYADGETTIDELMESKRARPILDQLSWLVLITAYDGLAGAAQPKPVPSPSPKGRATKTKRKAVAPVRQVESPKPNTRPVVPTKAAPKTKPSAPTKPVPKTKRKPLAPTKPVPKTKRKPLAPTKPVPKTKTKPVAPAKRTPKVKPTPTVAPTKGAKTKPVVAAAKAPATQAKTSPVKPTRVAGPGLRCLENHPLGRRVTGRLYCAICDR